MPLWQKGLQLVARRLPKVIGPRTHTVFDCGVAGTFVVMVVLYWKRNRRAALGSFICGGASALNLALTDYPGGQYPLLSYKSHGSIDAGIAALTAAMPRVFDFGGEPEAGFFSVQALAETAISTLTDFDYYEKNQLPRGDEDAA